MLSDAVARYYFKLLAVKDEYEVARLYAHADFRAALERNFTGDYRLRVHLAPPLLAARDPETGRPEKTSFGPWLLRLFPLLARMKRLRGTVFDIFFGHTGERRAERRLAADYAQSIEEILATLNAENYGLAVGIASIPEKIRGFGHVKAAAIAEAGAREAELMAAFRSGKPVPRAAE